MTAISDAKLIMETLAGKTLAGTRMVRFAEDYIRGKQDMKHAEANPIDLDTASNSQKAQAFLDELVDTIKDVARQGGEIKARQDNATIVAEAGNSAASDL